MSLPLEDTPRKAGESGLLGLTGLTPNQGTFHFCQDTGMLPYQLPKEYTDKGTHGRHFALGPAREGGTVNWDLAQL